MTEEQPDKPTMDMDYVEHYFRFPESEPPCVLRMTKLDSERIKTLNLDAYVYNEDGSVEWKNLAFRHFQDGNCLEVNAAEVRKQLEHIGFVWCGDQPPIIVKRLRPPVVEIYPLD